MKKVIHRIKNIRQEPEYVRRHVLHGLTIIFAVILLSLWVYSLGTNFKNEDTEIQATQSANPLNALKANFVGGYNSIVNPVPDVQE